MKILPLLSVLIVFAVLLLLVAKKRGLLSQGAAGPWPFYIKKPLTQPEQVLYHRLIRALPEHIVLAQVQVSRVLGVKKGAKFNEWNNRINRLSYDFVVCNKDSTVIAAIELDDKSHESGARAATDNKKNKATGDAGLRLIRWHVRELPDEAAIKSTLASTSVGASVSERAIRGASRKCSLTHGSSGLAPFGCAGPSFHSGPGAAK